MPGLCTSPRGSAPFIDWLFSQLPGTESGYGPPLPLTASAGFPSTPAFGTSGVVGPQTPPPLKDPADLEAAQQWLQAERGRLEAYTRSQFEMIRQQHQALLAKHFRSEETLALRSQELNREMQFLAAQTEAFQRQAQELAERERVFAAQTERLSVDKRRRSTGCGLDGTRF